VAPRPVVSLGALETVLVGENFSSLGGKKLGRASVSPHHCRFLPG